MAIIGRPAPPGTIGDSRVDPSDWQATQCRVPRIEVRKLGYSGPLACRLTRAAARKVRILRAATIRKAAKATQGAMS